MIRWWEMFSCRDQGGYWELILHTHTISPTPTSWSFNLLNNFFPIKKYKILFKYLCFEGSFLPSNTTNASDNFVNVPLLDLTAALSRKQPIDNKTTCWQPHPNTDDRQTDQTKPKTRNTISNCIDLENWSKCRTISIRVPFLKILLHFRGYLPILESNLLFSIPGRDKWKRAFFRSNRSSLRYR